MLKGIFWSVDIDSWPCLNCSIKITTMTFMTVIGHLLFCKLNSVVHVGDWHLTWWNNIFFVIFVILESDILQVAHILGQYFQNNLKKYMKHWYLIVAFELMLRFLCDYCDLYIFLFDCRTDPQPRFMLHLVVALLWIISLVGQEVESDFSLGSFHLRMISVKIQVVWTKWVMYYRLWLLGYKFIKNVIF